VWAGVCGVWQCVGRGWGSGAVCVVRGKVGVCGSGVVAVVCVCVLGEVCGSVQGSVWGGGGCGR